MEPFAVYQALYFAMRQAAHLQCEVWTKNSKPLRLTDFVVCIRLL